MTIEGGLSTPLTFAQDFETQGENLANITGIGRLQESPCQRAMLDKAKIDPKAIAVCCRGGGGPRRSSSSFY